MLILDSILCGLPILFGAMVIVMGLGNLGCVLWREKHDPAARVVRSILALGAVLMVIFGAGLIREGSRQWESALRWHRIEMEQTRNR